jgi:hypothetical protein
MILNGDQLTSLERLMPDADYKVINGEEVVWNDSRAMPSIDALNAEIANIEIDSEKDNLYSKLQYLCDEKTQEAQNYITGKLVTPEQYKRYKDKYMMAKKYLEDGVSFKEALQLEADFQGITVDDLAKLIVKLGDEYYNQLSIFSARIEAFRIKVGKLIEAQNFDKVRKVLAEAEKLGASATDNEVKALFDNSTSSTTA